MEVLEVFPCDKCGKTFEYTYALKRHMKHCGAIKPRKCRKCLKLFKDQLSASSHEIICFTDDSPLICKFCSKTFEHLYNLQRHYRGTHHIKMSELKEQVASGKLIDYSFTTDEEKPQTQIENKESDLSKPAIYTIEIDNMSNNDDSDLNTNVQTLIFKIIETPDSTEFQILPENNIENNEYKKCVEKEEYEDFIGPDHFEENNQFEDIIYEEEEDEEDFHIPPDDES